MNAPKKSAMSELSQRTNVSQNSRQVNKAPQKKTNKPAGKKKIINAISVAAVIVLIIATAVVVIVKNNAKPIVKTITADAAIGISKNQPKSVDVTKTSAPQKNAKNKVSLVFYDKDDVYCYTNDKSLGSLMNELGISLSDNEQMKYDLDTKISEDTVFNIDNVTYGTDTGSETIDFETEYVDVQSIPYGQTQVHQDGVYGIKTIEYTVTYVNGQEVAREKSGEYISQYPTDCIVYRGIGGTVYVDGLYYPYSHVLDCDSTVYTVYHGKAGTAYGLPADENVIAVDPNFIPLGTRVYVEGVGIRIAADTGTAIIGNIIDIYFDYDNPLFAGWGRRPIKVYVLR